MADNLPLADFYHHKPLVFAHRGASFDAPENTLAAFRLAREMGADGVELDTLLTSDGYPVVIHDFSVDGTTNGTGRVRDLTLKDIKKLDAGSAYDIAFKGEQVPLLSEALTEIGPMWVNIELKSTGWMPTGLESAVLKIIREMKIEKQVIISSFNPFALRRFHKLAPDIPIGYLYAPDVPAYLRLFMVGVPHQARHPQDKMIDAAYMQWAHANNYRVNTWTVDDPARATALRDLGVDAIITNRPDLILQTMGRPSSNPNPKKG